MRLHYLFITLIISLHANGQSHIPADSLLKEVPELVLLKEVPDTAFVEAFHCDIGYMHGNNQYRLHKDSTFDFIFQGYFSYRGNWSFDKKRNLLVLHSKKRQREDFHLIRFTNYLYLLPPSEMKNVVNVFKISREKHKSFKPTQLEVGGRLFTSEDMVAVELSKGRFWIY